MTARLIPLLRYACGWQQPSPACRRSVRPKSRTHLSLQTVLTRHLRIGSSRLSTDFLRGLVGRAAVGVKTLAVGEILHRLADGGTRNLQRLTPLLWGQHRLGARSHG